MFGKRNISSIIAINLIVFAACAMHIGRTEKKNLKINQILSKIPYVHIGMGLVALKKSFSSILVCNLASEESQILFIGPNIFVFKEPIVGTLNLCLKDA